MKAFIENIRSRLNKPSGSNGPSLGTFGGVFTPDVLTILGVIMYLRLGWVIGNAGLLGTIAIILLAKSITVCTALSMSSIITNIKIGAGGAYSIIAKSLGLEAGGSVGIPFYVSQTLSAALYIVGFTEGWLRFFPEHNGLWVSLLTWMVLLGISYISAAFAIKVQYIVMVVIGLSLVSFFMTPHGALPEVALVGSFEDAGFWAVFAIFFPAVTGIMAGANLSGDLKNPRKAIPYGTLSAIGVTLVIYIALAVLAAYTVPLDQLRSNQMIMVDRAAVGQLVIWGILAATFSSALGSMIGAPRILQALAEQKTVPMHTFFAKKTVNNEPRNAIVFTGLLIVAALAVGSLDALAALITMFFLITYGMLNLVVFIQQSLKIISFRPTFKIPRFVSFFGAFGCLCVMFLINTIFSVVAIFTIICLYIWLTRKGLEADWGDIRGGMFQALAERASRLAAKFPQHQVAWKPDLLIPISVPELWAGSLLIIRNIVYPAGSIFAFSVDNKHPDHTQNELNELFKPFKNQGILVNSAIIEDADFLHGSRHVIQTLHGGAFRPNTLFLNHGDQPDADQSIKSFVTEAIKHELGVIILRQHPRMAFGMQKNIAIWLRDKSPNWQLAMLITLQMQLNWEGVIHLVTVSETPGDEARLNGFLERLSQQARLPSMTEFHILKGDFRSALKSGPRVDINIFGVGGELSPELIRNAVEWTRSSCMFIKGSGKESATV